MLVLGILTALLAVAVGILALWLPRLVDTPEFRAALADRAAQTLGSPVEWRTLEIGIFPPRVILVEPVLVGQDVSPQAPASLRVATIDLRLGLWPLFERRIEIRSLTVRGLDVVVSRAAEGIVLPAVVERLIGEDDASEDEPTDRGAFGLDVRALEIADGRILVHDRILSPSIDWRLEGLELRAAGHSLGEPLDVEAEARAFADDRALGALALSGRADLAGAYDLDVDLVDLALRELDRFAASVDPDLALAGGTLSGRISLTGDSESVSKLSGRLDAKGLAARLRGAALEGDLTLRAERRGEDETGIEADFRSTAGGALELAGRRTGSGDLELTASLAALELAPFSPLAGEGRTLAGAASGEVSFAVAGGAVGQVEVDLEIPSARYSDGRIDAKGKLGLGLGIAGFEPSDPTRIQAVFEPETGGRLDVHSTGTVGGRQSASLRFDAFDLALVAPLLPEATQVAGKLTGEIELEATAERTIESLASDLRLAGGRLTRGDLDVRADVGLEARSEGNGPIAIESRLELAEGGRVGLVGTSTREGVVDLAVDLERFELGALAPFVATDGLAIAGQASGRGKLVGPVAEPESISLDLSLANTAFERGDLEVAGPLELALAVAKPLAPERSGTVELDLAAASLAYANAFEKPAGTPMQLATRFENAGADSLRFESRGRLNNVSELVLKGELGPATSFVLSTSAFDLSGWSALLPALAALEPTGNVAFDGFSLVRSEGAKDRFGGRIDLRGVDVAVAGAGRARLRGRLDGAGERLELSGLSATLHGLTLGLEGRIEEPLADARFEIAAHSIGEAQVNDLVSGLTSVRDVLFGSLRLDAALAGIAGGEADLLDTLGGRVRFSVGEPGDGRLRGVSLLEATLGQIPLLGGATRIASRLTAQPGGPDYLADEFQLLEGDLVIANGAIDAKTLRLAYRGHEARVAGKLVLDGLAIDMRGELLLDAPLVAALSGRPVSELAGRGPVRIPLARITNTLSDPKVSLAPETLAAVPRLLLLTTAAGAIVEKAIDQTVGGAIGRIGEQTGKVEKAVGKIGGAVGDVIGGVVGRAGESIGGIGGGIGGGGRAEKPAPSTDEPSPSPEPGSDGRSTSGTDALPAPLPPEAEAPPAPETTPPAPVVAPAEPPQTPAPSASSDAHPAADGTAPAGSPAVAPESSPENAGSP